MGLLLKYSEIFPELKSPTPSILRPMSPDSRPLEVLIASCAHGDHVALAQIYERTHMHLFGVAVRMLKHEASAEDVLQEAFVSIWKSAGSYRTVVNGQTLQPMTWLIAIVRNKALDALRAHGRRREALMGDNATAVTEAAIDSTAPSAMDMLSSATAAMHIEACMSTLDSGHRQSLALAYYQGLSHSEVAEQMGAPLGSVKAWIRRGLAKLKGCLASRGMAQRDGP